VAVAVAPELESVVAGQVVMVAATVHETIIKAEQVHQQQAEQ
jgi:hypothetical protein